MDNYFTNTLVDITMQKTAQRTSGEDENPFIADLFNEKLVEIGHIQFIPMQNRIRITATISNEEAKIYNINQPRLEFLKFLFDNTGRKIKKAVRFYFLNSPNAQQQNAEKVK